MKRKVLVLGLFPQMVTVRTFSDEAFPGVEFAKDEEGHFLCISHPYAVPIRKPIHSGLFVHLQQRFGSAEKLRYAMGPYIRMHHGASVIFSEELNPLAQSA